eukprot:snap_masked-scaffold_38-processed-gene-2.38-mRNA-1 protein AED:0.00 eAED:0.00 QI:0/-1/0/1/-1/1/1/0/344
MSEEIEQNKYNNQSEAPAAFKRAATKFHNKIYTKQENPNAKFISEPGRYRLFVSYACPWANRTMIVRNLKGLQDVIGLTCTGYELPHLAQSPEKKIKYKGWNFTPELGGEFELPEYAKGFTFLKELYELAAPGYTQTYIKEGRSPVFSVPILFDEKTMQIVTNESAEIIVLLNSKFNEFCKYPEVELNFEHDEKIQLEMERVNSVVYPGINDGVYRCGFAKTQEAYDEAYEAHWNAMDEIEKILGARKYLTGDKFTLSDIRLFVSLIRYDAVYFAHFKTSRNLIKELPNMYRFLKEVYGMKGIKDTVRMDHIVKHYYGSHTMINPTGNWPVGPLQASFLRALES